MVGIMEFSRAWMTKNILTGAAREAARVAAVDSTGGGEAAGEARGNAMLSSAGLTGGAVDVQFGGGAYGTVTAIASYDFQFIVPLWSSSTLTSTTTMRREY